MKQIGPSIVTKKHCNGCLHLSLEDWKDYLENDETDSGTYAVCLRLNKNISSYYKSGNLTPDWCPYETK